MRPPFELKERQKAQRLLAGQTNNVEHPVGLVHIFLVLVLQLPLFLRASSSTSRSTCSVLPDFTHRVPQALATRSEMQIK